MTLTVIFPRIQIKIPTCKSPILLKSWIMIWTSIPASNSNLNQMELERLMQHS